MIKKLAVLVIEKADGSQDVMVGEKGEIVPAAREMIRAENDVRTGDVVRITALGEAGVLKQRRWKLAASPSPTVDDVEAEASTEGVEAEAGADEEAEEKAEEKAEGPDADEIREKLKAKGIKVPPRISVDNLVKMAIEAGVEV